MLTLSEITARLKPISSMSFYLTLIPAFHLCNQGCRRRLALPLLKPINEFFLLYPGISATSPSMDWLIKQPVYL